MINSARGVIFDVKKYAIHDGPGIRTSFFLKGCSLRCWWCHNPESLTASPALLRRDERCIDCKSCEDRTKPEKCPTLALEIVGEKISPQELIKIAKQDELFYDQSGGGVTFTGGEPLEQPEFLLECLDLCRKNGFHTAVDTSGYAPADIFLRVAKATDLLLFDLKHIRSEKHRRYTGVGNKQILENLRAADGAGVKINIRIPLIPTFNDDDDTLAGLTDLICDIKSVSAVNILPYHTAGSAKYHRWGMEYKMKGIEPPTEEQINRAIEIFAQRGITAQIGG